MKALSSFVLLLGIHASLAVAAAPRPTVVDFAASYDIEFGMLRAGEVTVVAKKPEADSYEASVSVETQGLVDLFAAEKWQGTASGRLSDNALTPMRSRFSDKVRSVEILFSGNAPGQVRADPPFDDDPWAIEPREQRGVADPVTALVSLLAPVRREAVCGRRVEAFDGQYRFAFVLGDPIVKEQGIRCEGAYLRIAGYKPKKAGKRRPFTVHYAQRDDGLFQVARVTLPTEYGETTMQLQE